MHELKTSKRRGRMKHFILSCVKDSKPHYDASNYFIMMNHEAWRRCFDCNHEWDAKKEGLYCPLCGKKGQH